MPDPTAFYTSPNNTGGVSYSELDNHYLNLSGVNRYPRQFKVIAGSETKPGLCSQDSSRDGVYFPQVGAVGVTLVDGKALWVLRDLVKVFNSRGYCTGISFQTGAADLTLTAPDRTGDLCLRGDIVAEQLAGTKDGVNTTFTTTYTYSKVLDVIHEGLADRTFTQTAGTDSITYTDTPIPDVGERLKVIYVRD